MLLRTIKNLLTSGKLSLFREVNRLTESEGRLIYFYTGIEIGLFEMLKNPLSIDEIQSGLNLSDRRLLQTFLNLGISLKELSLKKGKYTLKGIVSKSILEDVSLSALIRETVLYHNDIALNLHKYISEDSRGEYLEYYGHIFANSSRIAEPFIKDIIYHTVKKSETLSILEIGCGSGEYLKYYCDINRNNRGIAIDIDSGAVDIAKKSLVQNGISDNFEIYHEDIMNRKNTADKKFDLVTSFSNMHYFTPDEKQKLFKEVKKMLNKNGRFLIATGFKTESLFSAYYNLIFTATAGLHGLPDSSDVINILKQSGFSKIETVDPFDKSFRGIIAWR